MKRAQISLTREAASKVTAKLRHIGRGSFAVRERGELRREALAFGS
jgi:hypothetical protein